MDVGAWVYKHFDNTAGIAFLPYNDHVYKQAPYQECTKEQYEKLVSIMPKELNWNNLKKYEKEDTTKSSHELACTGNKCEFVDITN
jgi:ribonucleoside-diphosphate reductase alpha chain